MFFLLITFAQLLLFGVTFCGAKDQTQKTSELFHAVSSGDVQKVRRLIVEEKINVDSTNEYGETSLHLSAISNKKVNGKILALLLEQGAAVNKMTNYQYEGHSSKVTRTPLHWYIYSCDFEASKTLVEHGANP